MKDKEKRVECQEKYTINIDGLVKSPKIPFSVIPSRIGVRDDGQPESSILKQLQTIWTPVFTGVTTFYRTIKINFLKITLCVNSLLKMKKERKGVTALHNFYLTLELLFTYIV